MMFMGHWHAESLKYDAIHPVCYLKRMCSVAYNHFTSPSGRVINRKIFFKIIVSLMKKRPLSVNIVKLNIIFVYL